MYSYTQAGLPAAKRVQVNEPVAYLVGTQNHSGTATANLDSTYAYNTEGKITSMTYPNSGPSYSYTYDSMYRLSGMTQSGNAVVNGVSYNAANQMLTLDYNGVTETRTYNSLNQLIGLNAQNGSATVQNLTYNYPTGTNNGKLSSLGNAVSGETVTYTYDSLQRLLSATGSGWGESYGFDPFGNLLSKTVTAGSGPSLSQTVNTNNQISGASSPGYDANGNTSEVFNGGQTYSLLYDPENRVNAIYGPNNVKVISYASDAQNHRIWSWAGAADTYGNTTNYTVNVYSPGGQKLGAYELAPGFISSGGIVVPTMQVTLSSSDQYFGSRRLAVMDQLGSTGTSNSPAPSYFPWGEPRNSNPQDAWSFATYWTDSASGLDYANNRYYSNAYGRFMTPDPYQKTAISPSSPSAPQSWNRYAYVNGDPVNHNDPSGQDLGDTIGDNLWASGGTWAGCGAVAFVDGVQMPSPCDYLPILALPLATQPPPECTIQVFNRPIEATKGLNLPGAQHGYIVFTEANGSSFVFEGQHQGTLLKGADTYPGDNGPALPKDNPLKDHSDGSLTGIDVCAWLVTLLGDVSTVNAAEINYHALGPNSSSVLRYMLESLSDQDWFQMPYMIGYGSLLPGIETQ